MTFHTYIIAAAALMVAVDAGSLRVPPQNPKRALIVVDVQNTFGDSRGSLYVQDGESVVNPINAIIDRCSNTDFFDVHVYTQDWHPLDHVSWYTSWAEQGDHDVVHKQPFSNVTITYTSEGALCKSDTDGLIYPPYAIDCPDDLEDTHVTNQMLWPPHGQQNTWSSNFLPELRKPQLHDVIVKKGYRLQMDAYSAFSDNMNITQTFLHRKLQGMGITEVYVSGLALDFCVKSTALDAATLGYTTYLINDATKAVYPSNNEKTYAELKDGNVGNVTAESIVSTCGGAYPATNTPQKEMQNYDYYLGIDDDFSKYDNLF